MDFGLSEAQVLLDHSVRGFLREQVPIERVRELREAASPYDRKLWTALAELGVAGMLVPEQHGGGGLALLDAALVSQALGHAATPTPFLATSVMAPTALALLGGREAEDWLTGISQGELTFGVAVTELHSRREGAGVVLSEGCLSGKALMALDAVDADLLLIAVNAETLVVVDASADGLERTRLHTVDATRCTSELVFEDTPVLLIYREAGEAVDRMLEAGRIALAADVLGACEAMIEQAVAYAKQRKQFERVIGSFQSVKHICAEMVAEFEPARSLLWYAAHSFSAIPEAAPVMACQVLAHASEIAREIASVSTQVHGGIGWTDEQNLHFWFKRIATARHLLGGPEWLREQAAVLQGLAPAAQPAGE